MGLNHPPEGYNNSQAYLVPGLPFVHTTGTSDKVEFPNITRSITVSAIGGDAKVSFTSAATEQRKFVVPCDTSVELPVRVRDVWIEPTVSASIMASLTFVYREQMPELSSTDWTGV
jgi:hypothetical protein